MYHQHILVPIDDSETSINVVNGSSAYQRKTFNNNMWSTFMPLEIAMNALLRTAYSFQSAQFFEMSNLFSSAAPALGFSPERKNKNAGS